MKSKEISDEEFVKMYKKFEKEILEDFIAKNNFSDYELIDTMSHLIHHRELMRHSEIEMLEKEAEKAIRKLRDVKKNKLLRFRKTAIDDWTEGKKQDVVESLIGKWKGCDSYKYCDISNFL